MNANFIKQSLVQSGYDPDNLDSHGEVDINKELAEALDPARTVQSPGAIYGQPGMVWGQ